MSPSLDDSWDYADPAGSETRLRAWLAEVATDSADAAEARTQIARALVLQRRFAEGHAELDLVEPRLSELPERVQARYYLERGRTLRDEGDESTALDAFTRAWKAANASGDDGLAVDAAHMLALVTPLEEAERWVTVGVDSAAASGERRVRGWAFTLSKNHAHRLLDAGHADAALRWFERANGAAAEFERPALGRSVACGRARAFRLLGRLDEAEALARGTLAQTESEERVVAFLHEEIGELLLARGDDDAARPHLRAAVDAFTNDPWFGPTESARLERLRRLLATT